MAEASVPQWKTALSKALAEHGGSVVIQLASIDPRTPVPLVRSHIFRMFLSASSTPSLPLLITTTDIRTPKISQIISNPHVQVAWWIEGTQEQYRISGLASVIPEPGHGLHEHFLHGTRVAAAGSGLGAMSRENFDWEQKRQEVFSGMSGHMKASWCRPIPGSRLEGGEEEAKKWPVKLEEPDGKDGADAKKNWETALGNFALLVIDPYEVDLVQLGVVPNRRSRFWRTNDGLWNSEPVVP